MYALKKANTCTSAKYAIGMKVNVVIKVSAMHVHKVCMCLYFIKPKLANTSTVWNCIASHPVMPWPSDLSQYANNAYKTLHHQKLSPLCALFTVLLTYKNIASETVSPSRSSDSASYTQVCIQTALSISLHSGKLSVSTINATQAQKLSYCCKIFLASLL